ncbi:MAG: hypothetical protein J6K61_07285 [Clostridia bacterium]|nr:hypothetical protein [Clostridia bacterium]
MKKLCRGISLALALILSLGVLASCNGGGGNTQTGDRVNGSWDNVDFGGNTLVVNLSANIPSETTMGACTAYTMGPDKASTDKVQQKVYERNKRVADMLNIEVEYETTDLMYNEILADVEKMMQREQGADIYCNDIYGMLRAMFNGYFKNLLDLGTNKDGSKVQNFFDFSYDGWYQDYMKGVTLDTQKQYLMAGDYFIDLIRFSWCIFVNVDAFDTAFSGLIDYQSYDYTAGRIDFNGEWTYDDLVKMADTAHIDSANQNSTDLEDTRLGLLFPDVSERISLWSCGLSIVEWKDENGAQTVQGEGTPVIVGMPGTDPATSSLLSDVAAAYKKLHNTMGVYNTGRTGLNGVKEATDLFISGKSVLSTIILGEMESTAMRNLSFARGVLPFPKYSSSQTDFHTLVHDQAEIGAIPTNAKSPTMASAYMQAMNEESREVRTEYYENSLKVKYNSAGEGESGARLMIDLIYESVDSPFESLITNYLCMTMGGGTQVYGLLRNDAVNNTTSFLTLYNEQVQMMQTCLENLYETYQNLK